MLSFRPFMVKAAMRKNCIRSESTKERGGSTSSLLQAAPYLLESALPVCVGQLQSVFHVDGPVPHAVDVGADVVVAAAEVVAHLVRVERRLNLGLHLGVRVVDDGEEHVLRERKID